MNKKVEELVEREAEKLWCFIRNFVGYRESEWKWADPFWKEKCRTQVRQFLSHPDLALIDREKVFTDYRMGRTLKVMGCAPVIPLADALEERK